MADQRLTDKEAEAAELVKEMELFTVLGVVLGMVLSFPSSASNRLTRRFITCVTITQEKCQLHHCTLLLF